MPACLRHTAHPLQLGPVQVVGTCYLGPCVVDAFLPFFQIIGVVAPIGVEGLVVQFQDGIAYVVKEIAVVRNHEDGLVPTG